MRSAHVRAVITTVIVPVGLFLQTPADATELTCDDFPTQIDINNSIFGEVDSTNFDADNDGIGCEANPAPPTAYDLTTGTPVVVSSTTTTTTTTTPPAPQAPATPVAGTPVFTG